MNMQAYKVPISNASRVLISDACRNFNEKTSRFAKKLQQMVKIGTFPDSETVCANLNDLT